MCFCIPGYKPDYEVISGRFTNSDLTYQVVYSIINEEGPEPDDSKQPEEPETPDDKLPDDPIVNKPVTTLPSTGPAEVASAMLASGSVITAAGYYVASRRALRK